jgi:AcrR family transcriptional regulator
MGENGLRRKGFDEVHELLLASALEVFALRGYSGATTSEIARRAGASEPLLFRHFGSKTGLFEAAVIAPFTSFVDAFAQTWVRRDDPHPVELLVYEFTSWTYLELRKNRSLAVALLGSLLHEDGPEIDPGSLRRLLDQCVAVIDHEARLRDWQDLDVPIATRLMLGTILAAALFKEWLFSALPGADDQEVVAQLVALVLRGVDRGTTSIAGGVAITEDRARAKVAITAPDQASALAAAAEWAGRSGRYIESMSWHDGELRIFYTP